MYEFEAAGRVTISRRRSIQEVPTEKTREMLNKTHVAMQGSHDIVITVP